MATYFLQMQPFTLLQQPNDHPTPNTLMCKFPKPVNMLPTLHGETDLADVIKLRVLTWGDQPGLSRWTQCNHKGDRGRFCPDREMSQGCSKKTIPPMTPGLKMEEGAVHQGMQAAAWSQKMQGNRFPPRASRSNIGFLTP